MNPPPHPSNQDQDQQLQHLSAQLSSELQSRHSLSVSPTWLTSFLTTVRHPPPPLPALTSTAHFRLLNSDFTNTLLSSNPTTLFPTSVSDVQIKSTTLLSGPIPVQVLAIEDLGASKWTQIEAIERVERGEEVRGREVIRSVPIMNEVGDSSDVSGNSTTTITSASSIKRSNGPHKLLLQDAAGTKVWAFEMVSIPKVFLTMTPEEGGLSIGCKLLVKKGTVVRRGVVMLRLEDVVVLGGKADVWDRAWRSKRKEKLKMEMVGGVEE